MKATCRKQGQAQIGKIKKKIKSIAVRRAFFYGRIDNEYI